MFSKKNIAFRLFFIYFLILLFTSIILTTPIARNSFTFGSYIDALFIAASSFSTTGLASEVVVSTYNFFGQLIILLLVQVGGLGIMVVKIGFFLVLGKKINISDRLALTSERGTGVSGVVKMFKYIIIIILSFELLMASAIAINNIQYLNNPAFEFYNSPLELIWSSLFHAISATNNAGLDVYSAYSLLSFKSDIVFQVITMICIIFGGIGFPVIYEIFKKIRAKKKKEPFSFSLLFKLSLYSYLLIFIITVSAGYFAELVNQESLLYNSEYLLHERILAVVFSIVGARNAGFMTIPLTELTPATRLIILGSMWIGASPSSTGGGIRGTTFAILLFGIISIMKKNDQIVFKDRYIAKKTFEQAYITAITSLFLIFIALFTIMALQPEFTLFEVIFELFSAFGTTGYSLGITANLMWFSKLLVILLMFIGQMGINATLLTFNTSKAESLVKLVEEEVVIS